MGERTVAGAICLAVLVALSGCSVPLVADGGGTETETTAPTAAAEYREAVAGHLDALEDAGQFRIQRVSVRGGGGPSNGSTDGGTIGVGPSLNRTAAADLAADRYLALGAYQEGSQVFLPPTGGEGNWSVVDASALAERRLPREIVLADAAALRNLTTRLPLRRQRSAHFDGEEMARYATEEPGAWGRCVFSRGSVRLESTSAYEASVLVDDRGIVRSFECELEGVRENGEIYSESARWTITDVGSATVEPPAAIANASESAREGA